MDRLFFVCLLMALLFLPVQGVARSAQTEGTQPVLFSMLFPQLMPNWIRGSEDWPEAVEAMYL